MHTRTQHERGCSPERSEQPGSVPSRRALFNHGADGQT